LKRADAILLAGVTFGSAAVLSAAILACILGSLSPGVAVAGLVVGGAAGLLATREARSAGSDVTLPETWTRWDWLALGAFALVSLRQFGWLVFERHGKLLTLLPHNYGDLPLHWTYIQHLASGASFWPENPILSQDRLRYPLGVDLLSAGRLSPGSLSGDGAGPSRWLASCLRGASPACRPCSRRA
jgi:hypothetical protein